jgi:hypothetical protein
VNCNCNSCSLAARPGYSNHQSDHALDLNTSDAGVLNWLNNHADEYGFARTVPSEAWHWEYWGAVDFDGPCVGPPIPDECRTGNYDGAFCDDDGQSTEESHDRLKRELDVDFHCADKGGNPAFCAKDEVTRAQSMFVLGKAADIPLANHPNAFTDDNGHPREKYLNAAKAYGILLGSNGRVNPDGKKAYGVFSGYNGGTEVRPDAIATRDTLAIVLSRMYALPETTTDYFSDDNGSANEAWHNKVGAAGLFTGYDDGNGGKAFKGSNEATKSTLATLATRAANAGLVPVWVTPAPPPEEPPPADDTTTDVDPAPSDPVDDAPPDDAPPADDPEPVEDGMVLLALSARRRRSRG